MVRMETVFVFSILFLLPCRNPSSEVLLHFGVLLQEKQILDDSASAGVYGDDKEASFIEAELFGVYLKKKKTQVLITTLVLQLDSLVLLYALQVKLLLLTVMKACVSLFCSSATLRDLICVWR